MSAPDIEAIAKRFIATQAPSAHTLYYLGAKRSALKPGFWSAVFEVRDADGHVIDGPVVVVIDEATRTPAFL